MIDRDLLWLGAGAAALAITHTVLGPDHYAPLIFMSRAGRWSLAKTVRITTICGLGHVLSSAVLGVVGIFGGLAIGQMGAFEGFRGGVAGWLLLGFGLAYAAWGFHRAFRRRSHSHWHSHDGGIVHSHAHHHVLEHAHVHEQPAGKAGVTPWALFTIFVLGPCEPLIPLLMYPAAKKSVVGMVFVATIFGMTTIATMTLAVVAGCAGLSKVRLGTLDRFAHAASGLVVAACGLAVQIGL